MFFVTSLLILAAAFAMYHVHIVRKRKEYSHIPSPPLPISPMWYLGHALLFKEKSRTLGFSAIFESIRKDVGGGDAVVLFFGLRFRAVIYITRTSIYSKILSDHRTYLKRTDASLLDYVHGQRVFGRKSIVMDAGTDIWYQKRRLMDPAFQKKFLRQLMEKMTTSANQLCYHLKNLPDQNSINIFPIMMRAALEVVCTCGFNLHDDFINKKDSKINAAVNELFEIISIYAFNQSTFWMPWTFRKEKTSIKEIVPFLRNFMKEHLKDRFEAISQEKDNTNDILSYIIRGNMFSDQMTIEDLLDDFMVFLIAGMETTAVTMTCFIWEILKSPDVAQKIIQEVHSAYDSKDELNFDDLNKLVYLEQCIKEALRLHSPVHGTIRITPNHPTTVDGFFLPSNTEIFISVEGVHYSEENWDNPMKFDPDRFGPDSKIKPFTFLPFTAGPRVCMGRYFAMMEMKVLISKLFHVLQLYDPRPEETELEKETCFLSFRPKRGVFIGVIG